MAENLVYRGHPLRRVDNLVYYGSMADKYIIMMQVLDTEDVKDLKLAKRVSIQLQLTDPNLRQSRTAAFFFAKSEQIIGNLWNI